MRKLIAVTGASGFLGRAIVNEAEAAGVAVRAVVRRRSEDSGSRKEVFADIQRVESLCEAFRGAEIVVHAAGLAHVFRGARNAPFEESNVQGSENVVRTALKVGVRHLVHVSSVSVYGEGRPPIVTEDALCSPTGPYASSKKRGEEAVTLAARGTALRVTILRMTTLYGKGDPGNVARLIRAIDRGRFVWVGAGENRKSLLHVADAARACVAVASTETGPGVEIYNGASSAYTLCEIAGEIAKALGRDLPRWRIPASLPVAGAVLLSRLPGRRPKEVAALVKKWLSDDVYDGTRLRDALQFTPRVSLREGIEEEAQWLRSGGVTS